MPERGPEARLVTARLWVKPVVQVSTAVVVVVVATAAAVVVPAAAVVVQQLFLSREQSVLSPAAVAVVVLVPLGEPEVPVVQVAAARVEQQAETIRVEPEAGELAWVPVQRPVAVPQVAEPTRAAQLVKS